MKFVMFGLLALVAASLAIALIASGPLKVVGILFMFMLAVATAAFVLNRFKGTMNLELDRRLPRALLTSDRR